MEALYLAFLNNIVSSEMAANKTLDLSFTSLQFNGQIVNSTIKDDIILQKEQINEMVDICESHYKNTGYIYIGNRKSDYNVNPLIYSSLINAPNLKGIAIFSTDAKKLQTANFEKQFSPVPFEIFDNLEEALVWAESMIASK